MSIYNDIADQRPEWVAETVHTPQILDAIEIGDATLVGTLEKNPPYRSGNCFSVHTTINEHYRIVNFLHENLRYLMREGILSWPVKIETISKRHAVIKDPRIPEEFYSAEFCEVCTPYHLWPETQKLRREEEIKSGEIKIIEGSDGFVIEKREVKSPARELKTGWVIVAAEDLYPIGTLPAGTILKIKDKE